MSSQNGEFARVVIVGDEKHFIRRKSYSTPSLCSLSLPLPGHYRTKHRMINTNPRRSHAVRGKGVEGPWIQSEQRPTPSATPTLLSLASALTAVAGVIAGVVLS